MLLLLPLVLGNHTDAAEGEWSAVFVVVSMSCPISIAGHVPNHDIRIVHAGELPSSPSYSSREVVLSHTAVECVQFTGPPQGERSITE